MELLGELTATAAPGFALLDADRRADSTKWCGDAHQQSGKDHRAWARPRHRPRRMLKFSRVLGERRMIDLNALIDEALNLAYHGAGAQESEAGHNARTRLREG